MQKTNGHRFDARAVQLRAKTVQFCLRRPTANGAIEMRALADAEAKRARHQVALERGRQIVEPRTILAADARQIGETFGGDEGRARALALKQGIGGDGRAMHDVRGSGRGNSPQAFQDHASRRGAAGAQFEALQAAVVVKDNKIRKSAAGVNPDSHPGMVANRLNPAFSLQLW